MLFERLLESLRLERSNIAKLIIEEQVNDFATYKFLAGKARGLSDAIDILRDTFKRYDDAEERR